MSRRAGLSFAIATLAFVVSVIFCGALEVLIERWEHAVGLALAWVVSVGIAYRMLRDEPE